MNITAVIKKLLQRLRSIRDTLPGGEPDWRAWIDDPLGLPPWQAWTLLALIRQRARQEFMATVIRNELISNLESLADRRTDGAPEGVVPNHPDWEFCFHGTGCCFTHRITGESINVDFIDDSADWVNQFFFIDRLESLETPTYVEGRVQALHPSLNVVHLSVMDLRDATLLETKPLPPYLVAALALFPDDWPCPFNSIFRLGFDYLEPAAALEGLEASWDNPSVRWAFGAALGDWMLLETLPMKDQLPDLEQRLSRLREERSDNLRGRVDERPFGQCALAALHDIGSPMLPEVLREALDAEPIRPITSSALDVLMEMADPEWSDRVATLLERVDPDGEPPIGVVWLKAVQYLLAHGRKSIVKSAIERNNAPQSEVAILSLKHFPEIAAETFRRSLLASNRGSQEESAAALAIIDRPWSRAVLTEALDSSQDISQGATCVEALLHTRSDEAHQRAAQWEQQHPHEETARSDSLQWIEFNMSDLHDTVFPLRNAVVDAVGD